MNKKQIPEPDLKALIEALRLSIQPDLEFQAVYEALMASFSIQARLFKALTDRKQAFVDVRINRKPRRIELNFSVLPQFAVTELLNKFSADVEQDLKNQSSSEIVDFQPGQNVENEPQDLEQTEKKRKGRGKAKKQAPARSLVSVLIDDSQIELLAKWGEKKDMNQSQLIRLAVFRLLQTGV